MRILALDQSYKRTGIALLEGQSTLLDLASIEFSKSGTKLEPWQKRELVATLVQSWCKKYKPDYVVVERVRLFSSYQRKSKETVYGQQVETNEPGISVPTIIALAKLNGAIVNAARACGIPVYSIDTKQWKDALLSRIPGKDKKDKATSVWYIQQVFSITADHDAAEAACIALASHNQNLLKEET